MGSSFHVIRGVDNSRAVRLRDADGGPGEGSATVGDESVQDSTRVLASTERQVVGPTM